MYQVVHDDNVYVCQKVELEVDIEWVSVKGGSDFVPVSLCHDIRMEGIILVNGERLPLNDANHEINSTIPAVVTPAKEAE